jgi:hypothetical protein
MNVKNQLSAIDARVTSNANNIEQLKNSDRDLKIQLETIHRDLMAQTNAILGKFKK